MSTPVNSHPLRPIEVSQMALALSGHIVFSATIGRKKSFMHAIGPIGEQSS